MQEKNSIAEPTLEAQLKDLDKVYNKLRREIIDKQRFKDFTKEELGRAYIVNPHRGKVDIKVWAEEYKLEEPKEQDQTINNGGPTHYYDLPTASERPTLDDLIEFKKMQRWQAEVFKASYAIKDRAKRATDGSSSEVRELHKMVYYINRRLSQLSQPNYTQTSTCDPLGYCD